MRKILSVSLMLLLLSTMVKSHDFSNPCPPAASASGSHSDESRRDSSERKFDCLPKNVRLDEAVSYGRGGKENVTVGKKLLEMKARCRNGKLVDARNKEIRFFRISCWGNPPSDYLEISRREHEELTKLKKRYTVIVMTCDPMTA